MPKRVEVTAQDPRYILRLDDIPKCIEADGVVWPTFLTIRDCARLFHLDVDTARDWVQVYNLPAVKIGRRIYVNVPEFNDWLLAHAWTPGADETEDE